MLGRIALCGFALGALWTAYQIVPSDETPMFPRPAQETLARLGEVDRVVEGTGLGSLTIAPEETRDNVVTIVLRRAGDRHKVPCRVAVSAVSEASSRAVVDCRQPGRTDGDVQQVAIQAITLVMREHVAAAVDARPYDIDGVANRMMLLVATNGPKLAAALHDGGEGRTTN